MIKAIVFDYGGVIKLNSQNLPLEISIYLKIDIEDFRKEYFKQNHLFNTGSLSFEALIISVVKKFDTCPKTEKYILKLLKDNYKKYYLNTDLINYIQTLKAKGYIIGLLSNNSSDLRKRLENENIIHLFNTIIISSEVGFQKPDAQIFYILFDSLNLKPDEVIFIDDSKKSLSSAKEIGYTPIHFKNNEDVKSKISKLLL